MSCSVEEPTLTTAEKRAVARRVHAGFCCKCKAAKSSITIRYAEYCDPCFLISMDSKFRTALRNTRPLRVTNPENVMLAFSGGPASRSLIHLFDVFHSLPPEVASNKLQPKLYSEIHLCHIDESCLNETQTHQGDANNTSTSSTMEQAEAIAARYGYRLHGIRIEDVYDPEWSDSGCFQALATLVTTLPREQLSTSGQAPELLAQILPYVDHASCSTATRTDDPEHHHHHRRLSQIEKIQKLRGLLGSFTTLTAKELIVQHFRSSLLAQQAKRVNCSYLALGDSATRVAIQIISLTALGRGFSLPHETAAMSLWIKDVKIIRPLKDCLVKEVEIYARLKQLELIGDNDKDSLSSRMRWMVPSKGEVKSIQGLTSEFIMGLDKEFPSTAATVCRTAAKLTAPNVSNEERCPVCHGPVQANVQEWKSRITVTSSPPANGDYSKSDNRDNTTSDTAGTDAKTNSGCCSTDNSSLAGECCQQNTSSNDKAKSASHCSSGSNTQADPLEAIPLSSLLCYGCLTNLRDLDLKSMMSLDEVVRSGQDYKDSSDDSTTKETQVAAETPRPTFEFPPHVAETVLQRIGYQSLNEYEQDRDKSLAASTTTAGCCSSATQTRDPREKLREQIQEFLITSDDEETQD